MKKVAMVIVALFALALPGWAETSAPVAVSPGSPAGSVIGAACPTFSWGGVEGARSYELVVYRVEDEGETRPILRQQISGSALSWTPALDRCLGRGERYAWSVRSVGGEEMSDWSSPSLFEVAAGPSDAELEEALAVVRRYAVGDAGDGNALEAAAESEAGADSGAASATPEGLAGAAVVEPTQLTVDGGIVAGSFTGDGSTLTALTPAHLSAGTAAIDISGNAATATSATSAATATTATTAATAATAIALGADPSACPAGQVVTDIAANGALTCAADGGIDHGFATGNTRVGTSALAANTTGFGNTASGYEALLSNTEGSGNTASGRRALFKNTMGGGNTAVGTYALQNNTEGSLNTASGYYALWGNSTGAKNTASGNEALLSNTEGSGNTASGAHALYGNSTGDNNTASGFQALFSNTEGFENTASGYRALRSNTTGNQNTAIGTYALRNNKGDLNVALGRGAGDQLTDGSNNIHIANHGVALESATIKIGTQGTQTRAFVAGIYGSPLSGSHVVVTAAGQLGTGTALVYTVYTSPGTCPVGTAPLGGFLTCTCPSGNIVTGGATCQAPGHLTISMPGVDLTNKNTWRYACERTTYVPGPPPGVDRVPSVVATAVIHCTP